MSKMVSLSRDAQGAGGQRLRHSYLIPHAPIRTPSPPPSRTAAAAGPPRAQLKSGPRNESRNLGDRPRTAPRTHRTAGRSMGRPCRQGSSCRARMSVKIVSLSREVPGAEHYTPYHPSKHSCPCRSSPAKPGIKYSNGRPRWRTPLLVERRKGAPLE